MIQNFSNYFWHWGSLWFKSLPSRSAWLNSAPVGRWATAGQTGAGRLWRMKTTALYPSVGGGYMIWKKTDANLSRKSQMPWFSPIPRGALTQPSCWLSRFHRPNSRFGSSSGPQILVESEYLISLSCQNDYMRPQRKRARPSAIGTSTTEGFWRY